MATTSFAHCERAVLAFDGGKVDHPNDPGGRANQRVYDGWRRRVAAVQRAAIIRRLRQLGIAS